MAVHTFGVGSHEWTVPTGVSQVDIYVAGAAGGDSGGEYSDIGFGSNGGTISAALPTNPGETIYIHVGGAGGQGNNPGWQKAGSPGAGATGRSQPETYIQKADHYAGAGGGMTEIRRGGDTTSDRIAVAGGGAGGGIAGGADVYDESDGTMEGGNGGVGGGDIGEATNGQYSGLSLEGFLDGTGGSNDEPDGEGDEQTSYQGDDSTITHSAFGGGGGGGYNWGEGGGYGTYYAASSTSRATGGGGGDGYVDSVLTNVSTSAGASSGNGVVEISYDIPSFKIPVGGGFQDGTTLYYESGSWHFVPVKHHDGSSGTWEEG